MILWKSDLTVPKSLDLDCKSLIYNGKTIELCAIPKL